jgi:hypothetical protein
MAKWKRQFKESGARFYLCLTAYNPNRSTAWKSRQCGDFVILALKLLDPFLPDLKIGPSIFAGSPQRPQQDHDQGVLQGSHAQGSPDVGF